MIPAFQNPAITGFDPKIGPQSGGTMVTVLGKFLDAGRYIDVSIDQMPCETVR